MEETKKKRGGKREGAGRKKGADTKLISVKIETELLGLIPNTNRSKYINYALRVALEKDGLLFEEKQEQPKKNIFILTNEDVRKYYESKDN